MTTIDVELDNTRSAVLQAIDSGDMTQALRGCVRALAILAMIPDSAIGQMSTLSWNRTAIESLMAELRRNGASSLAAESTDCGLEICDVEYVGIRSSGSSCCGGCS